MRSVCLPAGLLLAFLAITESGGAPVPKAVPKEPVSCVLGGEATCEAGKAPKLTITLTNNTKEAVQLVGSLDASASKRRYPHCYFEITGPDGRPLETNVIGCKFMNAIRPQDFVKVPAGGRFDPYQRIDDYGFFACPQLLPQFFVTPGEYLLRFVYSTDCDDLTKWQGNKTDKVEDLKELFEQVPKLTARSAEFKLTVVAPGK